MFKKQIALILALTLICGLVLCACAPEDEVTLSTPENQYVVAAALLYVNGALYLRENTDGHIYNSLPDGFVKIGSVVAAMPTSEVPETEFSAWNLLPGQMIYANEKDPGCVYVHFPVSQTSYCYVKMYRTDLYEYWSVGADN